MTTKEMYEHDRLIGGRIAGVDEAGRGPLAGPVVCACCIMGDNFIDGINDSKALSEKTREHLYEAICERAESYSVSIIDEKTIDDINILNATKLGMINAVNSLSIMPVIVLVDALILPLSIKQMPIIKGDATSYAIAAASILAKVTRDRLMRERAIAYPLYGFEKHKGYGTKEHIVAIKEHGACPLHRKSFIRRIVG